MRIKFDPEQLGTAYAFIGGLTYVNVIDRQKRRHLARIANKFGSNSTGNVYLNSSGWDYVQTLLINAVSASSKAIVDGHVKPEDLEKNNKTNQVMLSIIDKINKAYGTQLKNKNTKLNDILGVPKPQQKPTNNEGEIENESN